MGKENKNSELEELIINHLKKTFKIREGMMAVIIPSEAYESRKLESGYMDLSQIEKRKEKELSKKQVNLIEQQEKAALDQRMKFEDTYFGKSDKLKVALIGGGSDSDGFLEIGNIVSLHGHARIEQFNIDLSHVTESGYESKRIKVGITRCIEAMVIEL